MSLFSSLCSTLTEFLPTLNAEESTEVASQSTPVVEEETEEKEAPAAEEEEEEEPEDVSRFR